MNKIKGTLKGMFQSLYNTL